MTKSPPKKPVLRSTETSPLQPAIAADVRGNRLLSKLEVLDRIGVTFPTIWAWMRAGTFPRSVVIGGKTAWIESEVEAWIAALPRQKLKGDGEKTDRKLVAAE